MVILSHRGCWQAPAEKNGTVALQRSFELGFGTETDIRDAKGELVIAHDMPSGSEPRLSEMLALMTGRDLPIALNIKADGLAHAIQALMPIWLTRWFTFDMSVPEMLVQMEIGLPVFARASEFERQPVCYDRAVGVWLDAFHDDWYREDDVASFLADGKQVCLVSTELHGREPTDLWTMFRRSRLKDHPNLMICTDRPVQAAAFFGRDG